MKHILPWRSLVSFCMVVVGYLGFGTTDAAADLFFPQIAAGGGYVTVVTLMHTDARSATASAVGTMRFFNTDGTARTVTTSEMGTGTQFNVAIPVQGVRLLTITSSGPLAVGAARFDISGISVGGVATFTLESAVVGVLAAKPIRLGYIPLNTRTGFLNGVALQNPGPGSINVRFRLLNADGSIDQTSSPPETNPLAANAQFSKFAGPEMGFNGPVKPDSTLEIEVQGTGTFTALPLVLGNGLYSSSAIIAQDNEAPLAFPQVADGGGYTTVMRLFNPNAAAFSGTMRFFNPNGSPRAITVSGRGTGSEFAVSIAPKGTTVLQTAGTALNVAVGMARLDSYAAIGGVATIFFGSTHVGTPGATKMRSARIPVNTTAGYNTGVALAAGSSLVNVQLTLTNRDGVGAQAVQPVEINPMSANAQFAKYVTQMGFPDSSNLADSSLLIAPLGAGDFMPLALLDRNGVFSTTAVARQTLFATSAFTGSYFGTWSNNQEGAGTMSANFSIDPVTNIGTFNLSISGVFDAGDPGPRTYTGTVTDDGFTATLGTNGTLSIKPDGTLTLRPMVSGTSIPFYFSLDGEYTQNRFSGRFEVVLTELPNFPLRGTWVLNKQ